MRLLRNEKVRHGGRRMVVTEANHDGPTVEVAAPGWDGKTPGTPVAASEVVPLERMTAAEAAEFAGGLDPVVRLHALLYMAEAAPHALVAYGREFQPGLLPDRFRPAGQGSGAEALAAFEDVDGGDRRG